MALSEKQIARMREANERGLSPADIAEATGCSRPTVYHWLKSGKLGPLHYKRKEKKRLPPVEKFELALPPPATVVPKGEFGKMLIAIRPKLENWATAKVGSRAMAEDFVSSAFVNALAKRETFQAGTNFSAWIFQITRNLIINAGRERSRHKTHPLPDHDEAELGNPETTSSTTLAHETLVLIVTQLSWAHRDTMLAICYEGLGYEETAARYGVSVGTIKSRLWRGRARVRQLMAGGTP